MIAQRIADIIIKKILVVSTILKKILDYKIIILNCVMFMRTKNESF